MDVFSNAEVPLLRGMDHRVTLNPFHGTCTCRLHKQRHCPYKEIHRDYRPSVDLQTPAGLSSADICHFDMPDDECYPPSFSHMINWKQLPPSTVLYKVAPGVWLEPVGVSSQDGSRHGNDEEGPPPPPGLEKIDRPRHYSEPFRWLQPMDLSSRDDKRHGNCNDETRPPPPGLQKVDHPVRYSHYSDAKVPNERKALEEPQAGNLSDALLEYRVKKLVTGLEAILPAIRPISTLPPSIVQCRLEKLTKELETTMLPSSALGKELTDSTITSGAPELHQ